MCLKNSSVPIKGAELKREINLLENKRQRTIKKAEVEKNMILKNLFFEQVLSLEVQIGDLEKSFL